MCVGLGGKAGMPSGKSLGGLARYGGVRLPFGDVLRECFRFHAVTISKSFGPCFYVDVWFSSVFCNVFFFSFVALFYVLCFVIMSFMFYVCLILLYQLSFQKNLILSYLILSCLKKGFKGVGR